MEGFLDKPPVLALLYIIKNPMSTLLPTKTVRRISIARIVIDGLDPRTSGIARLAATEEPWVDRFDRMGNRPRPLRRGPHAVGVSLRIS